jgi:hypothetical protein
LQIYSHVLVLQELTIGEIHAKTAGTYQYIGFVQAKKGLHDKALHSLQKCMEIQEEVFGLIVLRLPSLAVISDIPSFCEAMMVTS